MSGLIDFGKPISAVESMSGGGWKKPPPAGYKFKVLKSELVSGKKAGSVNWYMEVDIAEGQFKEAFKKYPLRTWQNINTDIGKGICKRYIECLVEDNPGVVSKEVMNGTTFDPSVAVGAILGGILIYENGFATVDTFCRVDVAANAPVGVAPESKPKIVNPDVVPTQVASDGKPLTDVLPF